MDILSSTVERRTGIMRVRRPKLNFSTTPARWAAIPEFSQSMNAASLWIPHLERFLNRVMAEARKSLAAKDKLTSQLDADIRAFVGQESNHYATHAAFNTILTREGYPGIDAFEQHFEAEFKKLLSTRSLPFLCAYCEGFETLGPPSALVWLDEIEDLLEGAAPEVINLWKWHLLEEYEHRTVCYDVFHAISGGYFLRLYGFFFQLRQLHGFSRMVREQLMAHDRKGMNSAQRKESIRRAKHVGRRIARLTVPRLLRTLSPFYSPRKSKEPKSFRTYMAKIEAELV